ncbi:MAG TPA: hypothetical protein VKB19_12100 [Pedobacter sp.]|nr:hypothetical protein [Pedobacter sp.]
MKKQIAMMIALFVVVAAGCKKDKDKDNPIDGGNGKVKYISKVTSTDDDEQTIYVATYDSQNRLVSYGTGDNSEKTTFTYGANDNLVKYEFESDSEDGFDKETYEITYNASNVPTTGKHTLYNSLAVVHEEDLTYTVANGTVTQLVAKDQDDEVSTYKMTYQNGNVTKVDVEVPGVKFTLSATYGSKKSPFLGMNLKYLIVPTNLFAYYAKNELTSATSTVGAQVAIRQVTTYTYDGDGYPLTSTSTNPDDTTEPPTTTKYEYK